MSSQSSTTHVSLCAKGPTTSPDVHSPLDDAQEAGSGEPTRVGAAWEWRRKAAPSASATSRRGDALCAACSRGSAASRGACTLAAMVAAVAAAALVSTIYSQSSPMYALWPVGCVEVAEAEWRRALARVLLLLLPAAAPPTTRDRGASRTVCAAAACTVTPPCCCLPVSVWICIGVV